MKIADGGIHVDLISAREWHNRNAKLEMINFITRDISLLEDSTQVARDKATYYYKFI